MMTGRDAPILDLKDTDAPSVFQPANLLREARRQRGLDHAEVPAICLLDPDGDMVRHLKRTGRAEAVEHWACYHTEMWRFKQDGLEFGVVGCAVGAPFAVLLAEQMFASGCRFLISITSSGQITPVGDGPYFILIDRALRDEGTSYHYLPPSRFAEADPEVLARLTPLVGTAPVTVHRGATWTTDAPYRETEAAIAAHREAGILAVEMEAAALYAFSRARLCPVACFAHVTNTMAQTEGDFEKGEADGALEALSLVAAAGKAWMNAEGDVGMASFYQK
ncbi:MAG: nucleoside phosphorylase [Phaeospirillum sp.]|nr:nucleoside phosphorylase [Phaeospirillum sp.]